MRKIRALHRVGAVLALTALGFAAAPAPQAQAFPGLTDCREEPVAQFPDQGMSGTILPAPDPGNLPTGDPFSPEGPTLYETYGLAGYQFHTYDLGCNPVNSRSATANFTTSSANFLQVGLAETILAVNARVADTAYNPTWLAILDAPGAAVGKGLYDGLFTPLAPLALTICAVSLALALRKARVTKAVTVLILVMIGVSIAYTASDAPREITHIADTLIPEVTQGINTGINSASGATTLGTDTDRADVAVISPFVDDVLYPRWLEGTLGCSDCDVARSYGPDLYKASAFSWAEAATYEADPSGAGAQIVQDKTDLWRDTADKVKEENPAAYSYLIGDVGWDRMGTAAMSLLAIGAPSIFLMISFIMLMSTYLIWRLIVMLAPAWAIMSLVPSTQFILPAVGKVGLASVINSIAFAVIAAVETALAYLLLSPILGVNYFVGTALLLVMTMLLWFMSKPWRRLTSIAKTDPIAATHQTMNTTKNFLSRTGASLLGNKIGNHRSNDGDGDGDASVPGEWDRGYDRPVHDRSFDGAYRDVYGSNPPSPYAAADLTAETTNAPLSPTSVTYTPFPVSPGVGSTAASGGPLPVGPLGAASAASAAAAASGASAAALGTNETPSPSATSTPSSARPENLADTPSDRSTYVRDTKADTLHGRILGPDEPLPDVEKWVVYDTHEGFRTQTADTAVSPDERPENNRES